MLIREKHVSDLKMATCHNTVGKSNSTKKGKEGPVARIATELTKREVQ